MEAATAYHVFLVNTAHRTSTYVVASYIRYVLLALRSSRLTRARRCSKPPRSCRLLLVALTTTLPITLLGSDAAKQQPTMRSVCICVGAWWHGYHNVFDGRSSSMLSVYRKLRFELRAGRVSPRQQRVRQPLTCTTSALRCASEVAGPCL